MRSDLGSSPYQDVHRNDVRLLWWPNGDIVTARALDETLATDVSYMATKISLTDNKLAITLAWSSEFGICGTEPRVGHVLGLISAGVLRYLGRIHSMDSFAEERGTRQINLTSRIRDGAGSWKDSVATSPIYQQGASFYKVAEDVAVYLMGIDASEVAFTGLDFTTPHASTQFVRQSPYSMMQDVMFASGQELFVDVLNRMRNFSKDVTRLTDLLIPEDKVVSLGGQKERSKIGRVKLSWLSPILEKSYQQTAMLYQTSMTAGFFDWNQEEEAWFSKDRTQRATNSFLHVIDSVDAGILPVCFEEYEQIDETHGLINLKTRTFFAGLATASLIAYFALATITPAMAARIAQSAAMIIILAIMMSIGVGRYEIWGDPYDFVHAINTTLINATNLDVDIGKYEEHTSMLIANEGLAQKAAIDHLMYTNAKAFSFDMIIVDDPRIEVGDIVELEEEGIRLLVSGFSADFRRGAKAVMKLSGYRV